MMSFKRKAEDQGGPVQKYNAGAGKEDGGDGAGGGGAPPLKTAIPRHIGLWSHTIQLNCVSWEEIGNTVKWLPLHMFPQMFMYANNKQNLHLFERWLRSCVGYQIKDVRASMSNFQFLQDAITLAAGTPETTTAPTQAAYMICFSPKNQSGEQFRIGNSRTSNLLRWNAAPAQSTDGLGKTSGDTHMLVDLIEGDTVADTDFELLAYDVIVTDEFGINNQLYDMSGQAGFIGHYNDKTEEGPDPSPAQTYAPDGVSLTSAPLGSGELRAGHYFRNYVKNSSYMKMLKHGDTYDWNVHTNCDNYILKNTGNLGVSLAANSNTTVTIRGPVAGGDPELRPAANNPGLDFTYYQLPGGFLRRSGFVWPSKQYPPFSRSQKESNIGLLNHFCENSKTLNHKFFILAPMKNPDGTLVKQRCSVMLEQKMDITFWFRDDVNDTFPNDPETAGGVNPYNGTSNLPWNLFRDKDFTLRTCRLANTPLVAPTLNPAPIIVSSFIA